jgi:hypothetical protein
MVVTPCRLLNKLDNSFGGRIFKSFSGDDGTIELSNGGRISSTLDSTTFHLLKGINIFPNLCVHELALTSGDNLSDPSDEWRWIRRGSLVILEMKATRIKKKIQIKSLWWQLIFIMQDSIPFR